MNTPGRDEIEAAQARLRGLVVATPLIGDLLIPGRKLPPHLRIKPEILQPSGSIYFRGAAHWLLRQLGSCKGVVLHGAERPVLAAAVAASHHRLPTIGFTVGEPDAIIWKMLQAVGCDVRLCPTSEEARASAEEVRAAEGYVVMPGVEDVDYVAGLATVGLELASELPSDTEVIVVSPSELARAVAAGLMAGGASVRVEGVDAHAHGTPAELRSDFRTAMRMEVGMPSITALWRAAEHGGDKGSCAILAL